MDFDSLNRMAARQQLLLLGGIADAKLTKGTDVIQPVVALVEKGLQFPSDDGLTVEARIIGSLLVEEVGKVAKLNKINYGSESFSVSSVLDDDGIVVRVFLRGSTPG